MLRLRNAAAELQKPFQQLNTTQTRSISGDHSSKRMKYFGKSRVTPRFKSPELPNPSKVGVFHSGRRISAASSAYYFRFPASKNTSPLDPPALTHDYIFDTSDLILEPTRGAKGIVFNREHILNCFDFYIINMLEPLVKKYSHQPLTSFATFLKGKGTVFSSGTNFIEIFDHLGDPEKEEMIFEYFKKLYTMVHHVHNAETPVIPFMDGLTLGSAASFSVNCMAVAASPNTQIAWPETGFGYFPDAGGMLVLAGLPGGIGKWLALTGSRLTGQSLVKAGLATHCYDEEMVQALQDQMDQFPFKSQKQAWRMLEWGNNMIQEPFSLLPYLESLERCFEKQTTVQGIMKALADDGSEWCLLQLQKLQEKSPLSLVVTLKAMELIKEEEMEIDDVLKMDTRLMHRFLRTEDFQNGVKSLIINKSSLIPKWQYASVDDVPQHVVEEFFAPLPDADYELILKGKRITQAQRERAKDEVQKFYFRHALGIEATKNDYGLYQYPTNFNDPGLSWIDAGFPAPSAEELVEQRDLPVLSDFDSDNFEYSPGDPDHNVLEPEKSLTDPTYQGIDVDQVLSEIASLDHKLSWAAERPVEPTGRWKYDTMFDVGRELGIEHGIGHLEVPIEDTIVPDSFMESFRSAERGELEDGNETNEVEVQEPERPLEYEFGFSEDDLVDSEAESLSGLQVGDPFRKSGDGKLWDKHVTSDESDRGLFNDFASESD